MFVTYECKIKDDKSLSFLKEINSLYGSLKRKLFHFLYDIKADDHNALKRAFMKNEGISSTHYNSLLNDLSGLVKSRTELAYYNISQDKERIKQTQKTITRKTKRAKKIKEAIQKKLAYTKSLLEYKDYKKSKDKKETKEKRRKRGKPPRPRSQECQRTLTDLRQELDRIRFVIHQKKRRLHALQERVKKAEDDLKAKRVKICFGTRKLFHKQHNLEEAGYESHEEWREEWRFARSNQSYWLGDSTEKRGNRNVKLDLNHGTLRLSVPEALREKYGPFVTVEQIDFKEAFAEQIEFAIEAGYPLNYKIIERQKKQGKSHFYLQVTTKIPPAPCQTYRQAGAIGIDINTDHFALGHVDRFGNPVHGYSAEFNLIDKSKEQIRALLGDHVRDIVHYAKDQGLPLVMENLDFSKKRAALRETVGRRLAHLLSLFAYRSIRSMLESRCHKEGVRLITVNPAFSSQLGSFCYYGMKHLYTPHQMAAFVLARRGMGFQDTHKAVHNQQDHKALLEAVGIPPEKAPPTFDSFLKEGGSRHLWSYLRRYRKVYLLFMNKLKGESSGVYRQSLERWRSIIEGFDQSTDIARNISVM